MEEKKWIDSCRLCKNEVCTHVDHLINTKKVSSVRAATRFLSEELDGEIQPNTFRQIYKRHGLGTNVPTHNKPKLFKKPDECKTISEIKSLLESGQKFSTIYADPPWAYSNQSTRSATDGEYPTIPINELMKYPISELSTENAHLHLWTTNSFLHEALHLIKAWGFEYKSCFVWVKTQMGIGNYWRVSHEFLLLGVKGNLTFAKHNLMSWIEAKRTRHSVKPEKIRDFIESVSPPPYLELFGRRMIKGWTIFGNQIERTMFDKEDSNFENAFRADSE